jgi:thioredoxin-like negative regulator of GroEL
MAESSGNENRPSAASFLTTFVVVLMAIVVLFAVDTWLARLDRSENLTEATQLYAQGSQLATQGQYDEAASRFRSALADDRENRDYQLALAQALAKEGQQQQAEDLLRDLLRRDANDGAVNLELARLYALENHTLDAAAYFHRAIYGQWPQGDGSRLKARFELIAMLEKSSDSKVLLPELLPLQDEAPKDLPTEKRIARLYLSARAPSHAESMYRAMLTASPEAKHDAEIRAGLADAEFDEGAYRNAETDYLAALVLQDTPQTRQKLELCGQIQKLDPTQRGIGAKERYDRSRDLVQTALERFDKCRSASVPDADLADKAEAALKSSVKATELDRAMESNIDLAEHLWHAAGPSCGSEAQSPMALVLAKIAPR